MKANSRDIKPQTLHGNGTSLWTDSRGEYTVNKVEVGYLNLDHDPKEPRLHASVTLSGPDTNGNIYTDKKIETLVNENKTIMGAVRTLLRDRFKAAGITRRIPAFKLGWSEYGMQGENFWNFDLSPLTSAKK